MQHISGKGDTKFPDPDSILDELERKVKHVRWAIDELKKANQISSELMSEDGTRVGTTEDVTQVRRTASQAGAWTEPAVLARGPTDPIMKERAHHRCGRECERSPHELVSAR